MKHKPIDLSTYTGVYSQRIVLCMISTDLTPKAYKLFSSLFDSVDRYCGNSSFILDLLMIRLANGSPNLIESSATPRIKSKTEKTSVVVVCMHLLSTLHCSATTPVKPLANN